MPPVNTDTADHSQRLENFSLLTDIAGLSYNRSVYNESAGMDPAKHKDRFTHWWGWAKRNGLNEPEHLMPQIRVETQVEPFAFERRFIDAGGAAPDPQQINAVAPWAYQVEFGETSTLGVRNDADYVYHRYRASLLVDTAAAIAGEQRSRMSVLDVASHCGVFSLQFAERGFRHVTGVDLRPTNILQAEFLRDTFAVPNVLFVEKNARRIGDFPVTDVVFCGGLLYHVTFPMELLHDLWKITGDFLVLDTLTHTHPFSGFHLVCNKDVNYSAEGEFSYEFHPTYRAVCDALHAVGFKVIYELVGSGAAGVPNYGPGNVRSFVAAKSNKGILQDFIDRLSRRS